jgi:hypothetical protein
MQMPVEYIDSEGNELSVGDKVRVTRTTVLPDWDGFGREIKGDGSINTQTDRYIGEIVYNTSLQQFGVFIKGWAFFCLFEFESIELLEKGY